MWNAAVSVIPRSSYIADEFNNNDRDQLPNDLARLLRTDDSSSQISKSLPRQETSDTSVDLNIFNDEMRLRNNLENLYKKSKPIFRNIHDIAEN